MVNLSIEYSDKPVTPFGGMALMKRFVDQTGIRKCLAGLELPQGRSNRAYDPAHIIEGFWLGIWTGASRYIHCDWLRQDETLAAIFGYECLPSQSTYSRFFGKFSQARNTAVFPPLQRWFFSLINIGAVTVDFDSTVITLEGTQEGSAKGYNPNRKGRNSHHPLMAFISQTRMVACSNCVGFMRETFEEALAGVKVGLVRADSGFYTDEIMAALEERGLPCIIAAKAYANLKHEIHGLKDWVEICPGIAVKEWRHQPANPKAKARRHIVVRKQISRRPQAAGKLPACLLDLEENEGLDETGAARALFTAAAVGVVIGKNASFSGARGGCQAEVGSASCMAAAAVTEARGGSPEQACSAAAFALMNTLGMVCDPIGGYVEVPCVSRNGMFAVHSMLAAMMALAGVRCVVPLDDVVLAMRDIGRRMSRALKETSEGGLAHTPASQKFPPAGKFPEAKG